VKNRDFTNYPDLPKGWKRSWCNCLLTTVMPPPLFVSNAKLFLMPAPRIIKTRFVLQRDEFSKATKLALRTLPGHVKWAGWVQYGLLFALMVTGVAYRPNGHPESISLIVLVLVWLVFMTSAVAQLSLQGLQFDRMKDKEIWYEFDETGFRCGMPNSESSLDWPAITAHVETDNLFVLVLSSVSFYTIPKRVLAAEDAASLTQLLAERVPARSR
jgi:hypothetical protein